MINELMRRRALLGKTGENIPYQEVEWLETDSNAYIDSGIVANFTQGMVLQWLAKVGIKELVSSRRFLFSAYNVAARNFYCEIDTANRFAAGNATTTALSAGNMYDCEMELTVGTSNVVKINVGGSEYTATQTGYINSYSGDVHLCLFRLAAAYKGSGQRIGRNKIYKDGVLLRDFVPVRVGTTGYMYDKVSGTLFGNSGNGVFILGNDV